MDFSICPVHPIIESHAIFGIVEILEDVLKFVSWEDLKHWRSVNFTWNLAACTLLRRRSILGLREGAVRRMGIANFARMLAPPEPTEFGEGQRALPNPFRRVHLTWTSRPQALLRLQRILNSIKFKFRLESVTLNGFIHVEDVDAFYTTLLVPYRLADTVTTLRLDGYFRMSKDIAQRLSSSPVIFSNLKSLSVHSKYAPKVYRHPNEIHQMDGAFAIINSSPSLRTLDMKFRFDSSEDVGEVCARSVKQLTSSGWKLDEKARVYRR